MRSVWRFLLILCVLPGGAAAAQELSATVDSPIGGLPAVSADGRWFARPVIVHPAGCRADEVFVELGEVGSARRAGRSELLLVRSGCDREGNRARVERNVARLDAALRSEKFRSVGTTMTKDLPTTLSIDGRTIDVAVGKSGHDLTVSLSGGGAMDRWNVTLDGPIGDLRGWYSSTNAAGEPYFALHVVTHVRETGEHGRERWLDFFPVETADATASGAPINVAERWIFAMRDGNADRLAAMMATPFWKQGLNPVEDRQCRKKTWQEAKRRTHVDRVARCIVAGTSQLYARYAPREHLVEIDLRELPAELKRHRKKVARLVDQGATLVRYHVNDEDLYVFLVLVLDPDDPTKVRAALESIDVMTE